MPGFPSFLTSLVFSFNVFFVFRSSTLLSLEHLGGALNLLIIRLHEKKTANLEASNSRESESLEGIGILVALYLVTLYSTSAFIKTYVLVVINNAENRFHKRVF